MTDFITFLGPPLAGCILLSIVYTYLGCHVLKREIIFIDLSLAQLAALGTTVAFVNGLDLESNEATILSILFIVVGSLFFAWARKFSNAIPHEAVIGIIYIFSASAGLLLSSQSSHGAEHIRSMLNGSILWITWAGILKLLAILIIPALIHFIYRSQMVDFSNSYKEQETKLSSKAYLWDFLFYFSIGIIIVFSIKSAGVFLIFTWLIVPAACVSLFFDSLYKQFVFGSILGAIVSSMGLTLSYWMDLPTGSTIVCVFGVTFLISLVTYRGTPKKQ